MKQVTDNKFHFIYGLEYYLKWKYGKNDYRFDVIQKHKNWFLHTNYYCLYDLINIEINRGRLDKTDNFLKLLLNKKLNYNVDTRKLLEYICYTIDDEFLRELSIFSISFNNINVNDFLSKGQVESKTWIIDVLKNEVNLNINNIAIYGCWYGFLAGLLFKEIATDLIRGFDINTKTTYRADVFLQNYVNKNWKFKAIFSDVNELFVDSKNQVHYSCHNAFQENILEIKEFSLIINTSAEHMSDQWIKNFQKDQTILIQTNNMNHLEEHINCCESLDHAIEKYSKYGEIIWAGSKTMVTDYERYMIILKTKV